MSPPPESEGTSEKTLPKIAQILNNSETFHKFNDKFNHLLEGFFDIDKNKSATTEQTEIGESEELEVDTEQTIFLTNGRSASLDTREVFLTQFETSLNCSLASPGDNAKTYRLTPKAYCSPIVVGSHRKSTSQYYVFKPDGTRLNLSLIHI